MNFLISNADFPASNYIRIEVGNADDHRQLLGDKKSYYGGFTIRIDDSIPAPKDKVELQKLVNDLIKEACDARKAKSESFFKAVREFADYAKGLNQDYHQPKEIDTFDPDQVPQL